MSWQHLHQPCVAGHVRYFSLVVRPMLCGLLGSVEVYMHGPSVPAGLGCISLSPQRLERIFFFLLLYLSFFSLSGGTNWLSVMADARDVMSIYLSIVKCVICWNGLRSLSCKGLQSFFFFLADPHLQFGLMHYTTDIQLHNKTDINCAEACLQT